MGLRRLFPQAWESLFQTKPEYREGRDLIDEYYAALHGDDPDDALRGALNWSDWGAFVVNWHKSESETVPQDPPLTEAQRERLLAKVRIETHYAHHRYFVTENEILSGIDSLPVIPVTIVHGRYDLTCTMESAWLLHKAIPASRLVEVADAGHLIDDPAMISVLVEETDRMREMLLEKKSAGEDQTIDSLNVGWGPAPPKAL
jgi:proline iminopeptidase